MTTLKALAGLIALLWLTFAPAAYGQQTHHVFAAASGANDGSSWADAFTSLQDALTAARAGDEIWVGAGRYYPDLGGAVTPGDTAASFELKSDVAVYGGFSGTESERDQRNLDPATNGTLLDGDLDHDPQANGLVKSMHVVAGAGLTGGTVLDGFAIRDGNADAGGGQRGGGIDLQDSTATLSNLLVADCTAARGALAIQGAGTVALTSVEVTASAGDAIRITGATVTIEDAHIHTNSGRGVAVLAGGDVTIDHSHLTGNTASNGPGGGFFNDVGGTLAVRNSVIALNTNTYPTLGGLLSSGGGGFNNGNLVLARCDMEGNSAATAGFGLQNDVRGVAIVIGATFIGNHRNGTTGGRGGGIRNAGDLQLYHAWLLGNEAEEGGGIYNDGLLETMNLIFSGNYASRSGGGLHNDADAEGATLRNATLHANSAGFVGGGVYNQDALAGYNSIVWGNTDLAGSSEIVHAAIPSADTSVGHSTVQGGLPAGVTDLGGNLDQDPLFTDADGADGQIGTRDDDFTLSEGSVAIDAGNNDWVPQDRHDVDGDGDTQEPWPVDIGPPVSFPAPRQAGAEERERFINALVDMGPFERVALAIKFAVTAAQLLHHGWANVLTANVPDPINTASGELYFPSDPDFSLGGPLPLSFRRYYASYLGRNADVPQPLGPNWNHNFNWRLILEGAEATIISSRGRSTAFTREQDGAWTQTNHPETPLALIENASDFVLADPRSQLLRTFDAQGKLAAIEDGRGNRHSLAHAGDQLQSVADGLGRVLTFVYAEGKLLSVGDGTRTVGFTYTAGLLSGATDAEGNTTAYDYAAAGAVPGLLTALRRPEGNAPLTQAFDTEGRVATQWDALGNDLAFGYAGDTTAMTNALDQELQHTHDAEDRLTVIRDRAGESIAFDYDNRGRRGKMTDRLNAMSTYGYHDASGLLHSEVAANTAATAYYYRARQVAPGPATLYDLTAIDLADGARIQIAYDARGNVEQVTDAGGHQLSVTYNHLGQPLSITNPAGGVSARTYHGDGTPATTTDPAGNQTAFAYDPQRRLAEITRQDAGTRSFTYDANDRTTAITDEEGQTYGLAYDGNQRLIQYTDPVGRSVQFTYDAVDRLAAVTDRLGQATTYAYDALNRMRSVTDAGGNATLFDYDAVSNLTAITDPAGKLWRRTYDAEGVLTSASNPRNETFAFESNEMGWITAITNPAGDQRRLAYDLMGRLVSLTDEDGHVRQWVYDARGLPTRVLEPEGVQAQLQWDALGSLTKMTDPIAGEWGFNRDHQGRITSRSDPLGNLTAFTYNNRNRIAEVTFPGALGRVQRAYDGRRRPTALDYSDGTTLDYDRDALGRIVSATGVAMQRDEEGRIVACNGLAIGRDNLGRIASVDYPPGRVTYTHDGRDRLIRVEDWAGRTLLFDYDDAGRLTGITRPNGVLTTLTYDPNGRIASIAETGGAAETLASLSLVRDARGNVTQATREVPVTPALSPSEERYAYDAASQTQGFSHDALGRLTEDDRRTYTWNLASHLSSYTEAGQTVTFTYDAFGNRLTRTAGGVTRDYVWSYAHRLPSLLIEHAGGAPILYHIHSPAGGLLYSVEAAGGAVRYYHFDEMGNTQLVTGEDGSTRAAYRYRPYGMILGKSGTLDNAFTYQGEFGVLQEGDTGLYQFRRRYLASSRGRFLSRDPIQSRRSPYLYANANPQRFVDPSGLVGGAEREVWRFQERRWREQRAKWLEEIRNESIGAAVAVPAAATSTAVDPTSIEAMKSGSSNEIFRNDVTPPQSSPSAPDSKRQAGKGVCAAGDPLNGPGAAVAAPRPAQPGDCKLHSDCLGCTINVTDVKATAFEFAFPNVPGDPDTRRYQVDPDAPSLPIDTYENQGLMDIDYTDLQGFVELN